MTRILRALAITLVLLFAGAVAFGMWRNPERSTLDAEARTGAPGQFVASGTGLTHYEMGGPDTGRVAVLVHGFSVPSYIWDSTFKALTEAGIRTVRYDLFGRGWSDRPDAAYDGAFYDAQLSALLDSLHVTQPVDLVGLSFGGFVTAHFTRSHPTRVRTLTLVDPVSSTATVPGLLTMPIVGAWFFQTLRVPGMAEGQTSDFLHPERYPNWADQYRPQMRYRGFGRALLRTIRTLSETDFDSLYAGTGRTSVPALLIWGEQDQTVPIARSAVARRNIPQLEYFPVDSAGHLPHIEQSALVHARLLSFLRAHD